MRIAQISTVCSPVRQQGSASIESVVWLLTRELTQLGHDVTVFGCAGSEVDGHLVATLPGPYGTNGSPGDWQLCEWINLARAVERSGDFDILHAHAYLWGTPLVRLAKAPMVQTHHLTAYEDEALLFAMEPQLQLAAISKFQWSMFPQVQPAAVIPHGVDATQFPFREKPDDYLCFLGRFIPGKGPLAAIDIARRVGLPLRMAGPRSDYFKKEVEPHVDGKQVQYLEEVKGQQRSKLLGGAKALLYPNTAAEPFGLVLVEAMLCGTPVVATQIGAVPEVVEHGVTGYLAESADALAPLTLKAFKLDRRKVRQRAMRRFSPRRMAQQYVMLYEQVLRNRRIRPRRRQKATASIFTK